MPVGAPAAPSGDPGVPVQPRGLGRAARIEAIISSCAGTGETLQSKPGPQPTWPYSWVPLGFAAFLFYSFHHLVFVSGEMEVIKGSVDCPVNTGSRRV